MSKQSEKVKRWRNRTKKRIVQSMGGKCVCCGYNICDAALVLHHLDPSTKEFGFGSTRARSIAWIKIVKELRKCVLLCNRCHTEVHHGITKIPNSVTRFDEKYSEYKNMRKK